MRRVVVSGLGMLTPLGCGVEPTWTRLLKGESGAKKIDSFDVSDIACKIACVIPRGDGSNATYNPDQWMEPKEQRKVDEFIVFAMCAAGQALDDAPLQQRFRIFAIECQRRVGEVYRADDVHGWLERLARGESAARPKPWQR